MSLRAVEIPSGGGKLEGLLHLPEAPPRSGDWPAAGAPCVLAVHGLTLSHTMFEDLGKALAAQGQGLLRFHLRGHGKSSGRLEEQGFEDEVWDLRQALEFIRRQPGIDPSRLGLLGFSLGGAVACVTARRDGKVKALATWGSLLDTEGWADSRFSTYGRPENGVVRIWDGIPVSERLFTEATAVNPKEAALEFPGPYFAAHGLKDKAHPPEPSQAVVKARRSRGMKAEGFFPERCGHKFQVAEDWKELNARCAAFFKSGL